MPTENTNPLLVHNTLPDFANIRAEHVVPAVHTMLKNAQIKLSELEQSIPTD